MLSSNGSFFFYVNDWGGCPGVDCCGSPGGCASCCFNPPSSRYPDTCVYAVNHTVLVYRTRDFVAWDYMVRSPPRSAIRAADTWPVCAWQGGALPLAARLPGVEFRPQVVYNARTHQFVMWCVGPKLSGGASDAALQVRRPQRGAAGLRRCRL